MEGIGSFLPLILIFGVFYLLLIRPQQKKVKLHREMLSNIKRGDKIITSGGIIGQVNKVNDNRELTVEIASDVEIKIAPGMIADLYITPDSLKKVSAPVKENKGGFLSGIFGNKK
jgi:preprotein translocase subunit YajC